MEKLTASSLLATNTLLYNKQTLEEEARIASVVAATALFGSGREPKKYVVMLVIAETRQ